MVGQKTQPFSSHHPISCQGSLADPKRSQRSWECVYMGCDRELINIAKEIDHEGDYIIL